MGDGVFNSGSFAQRGTSTFGFDLSSELRLELFVLTDMQGPALAKLGFGALRSLWARITGAGWKLGVFAWYHWHGLAPWAADRPVRKVQGKGVLGEEGPALRPRAGNDVHALLDPLRNPRAGHVPQVDVQLQQARFLLQDISHQGYHFVLWLVGRAHHDLAGHMTIQVQDEVFLKAIERFGATLTTVPHIRVLNGDAPVRDHVLLDTLAPRPP